MAQKRAFDQMAQKPEPGLILCFGDSNTYGERGDVEGRLPYSQRWTTVLQGLVGDEYVVVPEGLNGRTTVQDDPYNDPDFCGVGGMGMNGRR